MRWLLVSASLLALGVACANPCERELCITENRCDRELAPDFEPGEQECHATDLKEAQCAIDHKDDYCEWLEAIADGNVIENDYVRCLLE